jgi:O-antigen biosynthesis protein
VLSSMIATRAPGAVPTEEGLQRLSETLERVRARASRLEEKLQQQQQRLSDTVERQRDEVEFLRARTTRREFDLQELNRQLSDQARSIEKQHAAKVEKLEEKLQKARTQVRRLDTNLKETRRAAQRTTRDLQQLRNRRSVRAALKLAAASRPVFRIVRRQRRRLATPAAQKDVASLPTHAETQARDGHDPRSFMPWLPEATNRLESRSITIIVPVHDAPKALKRCLDSIERNTSADAQLLIVDDASTLDETRRVLHEFSQRREVAVLRNSENVGFTRTVNRGISACDTDVILLNSDTEVPPRWLERLQLAAYSGERVGSATAISDDAGAFSVPVPGERNEIPPHLTTDSAGRAVAHHSQWTLPQAPTANGFCAYIRRDMLDDVGLFDEEAFPRGYGEENDLSMRARARGWHHVIADSVFVRHTKGTSFGQERESLIAAGRAIIDARYPDYTTDVRAFMQGTPIEAVRERVSNLWDKSTAETGRPRVLYIVHAGRGGTPNTTFDLAAALEQQWQSYVLTSDTRTLRLWEMVGGNIELRRDYHLDRPIRFLDDGRQDIREIVLSLLLEFAIELVHCRHLVKNTFDVLTVARSVGIPTIVSFHDYYLACPTVHLLDERDEFCGGVCTTGDGPCRIPMPWVSVDALPLKHAGVHHWRETVRPHLLEADALVTTSRSARDVYLASYPELVEKDVTIIEHGRELRWEPIGAEPPEPGGTVRLLVPGNLDAHKGVGYLRQMLSADTGGRLEVHLAGRLDGDTAPLGTSHGVYERDGYHDLVAAIRPHVIGIFSIWAETYCHTLSESWMTGVPVVATDIGAAAERIRKHGGGILVPVTDPRAALLALFDLVDDRDNYLRCCGPRPGAVRTAAEMAADYDGLYLRVLRDRRTFRAKDHLAGKSLDVGLVAVGAGKKAPGSVHVRTQLPLAHPIVRAHASTRRTSVERLLAGDDPDIVVVQRTAVPPGQLEKLEQWLDDRNRPLIFEIDDLLFDPLRLPDAPEDWEQHVATVRKLMSRADAVTVSTPALAEAAAEVADTVVVIPNAIDERLWFAPVPHGPTPSFVADDPPGTLRLLYVGTRTHAADLDLLRPVMAELPERLGRPVRLSVVGGEPRRTDRHWYRSIPVEYSDYPTFVPWIRRVASVHDIALAPLLDSPFNRAKSNLKWLEYTAMGLPGIFADLPPYSSVEHGRTGLLAPPKDVKAWVNGIASLEAPEQRDRMVAAARQVVLQSHTLERTAAVWVEVLSGAAAYHGGY